LLDAGTNPSETLCLLVDRYVDADAAQARGGGKATDAGTDDRDG
jgi:hypothetical protein